QVLVSDKKYACETCIKGHRSSACKHTDRPLFEIKKKGRPVTQCDHCRELRKTKQVHVKCLCGVQEPSSNLFSESSHSQKGATKLPAIAAFPHGLPEDLEAIAILPAVSDGSVDSDHSGETSPSGCRCNKGEQCDCAVPRKPAGRRRSSVHHQDVLRPERHHPHHHHHAESSHGVKDPPPPLSSHVLARIAELRPVLPRPPRNDGPLHDPSSSMPHSHGSRHHTHENMYFSPYGRAYDHVHTPDHYETKPTTGDTRALPVRHQPPLPGTQSGFDAWQASPGVFPSACACGDSCRCPGCSQHSNSPIAPGGAYSACANPASCSFCLDCTILSLPPSSAPPTSDSASDSQTREFEEWLRQI
ncbi:copper-fist-domain-containing protein, partial [Imleria badia]